MRLVCIQNSSLLVYRKSQKVSASYCIPFQHSSGKNQPVGGFRPPPPPPACLGLRFTFQISSLHLGTSQFWQFFWVAYLLSFSLCLSSGHFIYNITWLEIFVIPMIFGPSRSWLIWAKISSESLIFFFIWCCLSILFVSELKYHQSHWQFNLMLSVYLVYLWINQSINILLNTLQSPTT